MTLTVRDEWTLTNTSAAQSVTIVEPPGNSAPVPTFITELHRAHLLGEQPGHGRPERPAPDTADTIAYSWNWGDGTALSTGASPSPTPTRQPASYTITLTTTDGWGKFASTTRNVTLTEPAGNNAPSVAFTFELPVVHDVPVQQRRARSTPRVTRSGTRGPSATAGTSTSASPVAHLRRAGTYTVVLTVTDVWGKVGTATHDVTMTEPAGNTGPTRPSPPPAPC